MTAFSFTLFLKTLAAGAISGAVTAMSAALTTGGHVETNQLVGIGITGAIVGASAYLAKSPRRKPRRRRRAAPAPRKRTRS